jgi:hypothetical protein
MATGAGSPPFQSLSDDITGDRSANPFEVLWLSYSNLQILQLAKYFREHSDGQILSLVEEYRCHCE